MIMKPTIRAGVCTIIACSFAGLAQAGEPSGSHVEVRTKALSFNRTKLETASGARVFYSKLRHAAQEVCSDGALRVGHIQASDAACASNALDNAVTAVNAPTLYAVHGKARSAIEVLAKR
jgi:UrcA family protein